MRRMLEYMADRIEAVLRRYGIPGQVISGTVAARVIRFKVILKDGADGNRVLGLVNELAAALNTPGVRVARQGVAAVVEVPRPGPVVVHLLPLLRTLQCVPPVTATLGLADDGAPLLIRLPSPVVAHILVAGAAGSGKTVLLRTMILSLALRHPRQEELALVLAGQALTDLSGLPHLVRPVITDGREAAEVLHSLVRLTTRRAGGAEAALPVVTFFDELTSPLGAGGPAAERDLRWLLQSGRVAGVHLIATTRYLDHPSVRRLIGAFPVRIVGRVTGLEQARVASGWPGTGAERLSSPGDFIAVAEGQLTRFQAAYVTPGEATQVVAALRQGGQPRLGTGTEISTRGGFDLIAR